MDTQEPVERRDRWQQLALATLELGGLVRAVPRRERLAEQLLCTVGELFPGSRARLLLAEDEGLVVHSRASSGLGGEQLVEAQYLRPDPACSQWVQGCGPEGSGDMPASLGPLLAGLERDPMELRLWPLLARQQRLGLLCIGWDGWGRPGEEDLARALAGHAAVCLENGRLHDALELEARTDGLTGAANYRHLLAELRREQERATRSGESFAVLMVDVDNLKEYNDLHGHLGGSQALRELAGLLARNSRSVDVVAKYGGDEFCVLLPNCSREGARVFAARLLDRVREHRFEDDPARRLTISVGISIFPEDASGARELLRAADEQLYAAKRDGRDRIRS